MSQRLCIVLFASLLWTTSLMAGHQPAAKSLQRVVPHGHAPLAPRSPKPQAALVERLQKPFVKYTPALESQHTAKAKHPKLRKSRSAKRYHKRKRLRRRMRGFLASLAGFVGLILGGMGVWYWLMLVLVVPLSLNNILVSTVAVLLSAMALFLGYKSVNRDSGNPWGIAAIVSGVVGVLLMVLFLVILLV